MKIVNLQTFLGLPSGTVFFQYVEDDFDLWGMPAILIKLATLEDNKYQIICPATDTTLETLTALNAAFKGQTSHTLDQKIEVMNPDFNDERLYAVFEEKDAKHLVSLLVMSFADAGLIPQAVAFEIDQLVSPDQSLQEKKPFIARIDQSIPVDAVGNRPDVVVFDTPTFTRPRTIPTPRFARPGLERPSFRDSKGDVHVAPDPLLVPEGDLVMLEKSHNWSKVKVIRDCEFEQAVQQGFCGTPERWLEVKDWYVQSLIKARNGQEIEVDFTNILHDATGGLVDADGKVHRFHKSGSSETLFTTTVIGGLDESKDS